MEDRPETRPAIDPACVRVVVVGNGMVGHRFCEELAGGPDATDRKSVV